MKRKSLFETLYDYYTSVIMNIEDLSVEELFNLDFQVETQAPKDVRAQLEAERHLAGKFYQKFGSAIVFINEVIKEIPGSKILEIETNRFLDCYIDEYHGKHTMICSVADSWLDILADYPNYLTVDSLDNL